MSVKIRMARVGRKNVSRFRVVAIDERTQRDGKFLEVLGTYNPQANPKQFALNAERITYWIGKGAEISETVHNLLKQDRYFEKAEGLKKGLGADSLNLPRLPERKRKPKNVGKKKSKEAQEEAPKAPPAAPPSQPAAAAPAAAS
ncbi:MAG TPA: 30S ribosomal protein S16 [Chitinivibrionales bacterium]|nr:30S ribosomal protein S16 [Chitinivibrionales bacterium]